MNLYCRRDTTSRVSTHRFFHPLSLRIITFLLPSKCNSLTNNSFYLICISSIHSFLSVFSTCDLISKLTTISFLHYCNNFLTGLSIFPLAGFLIHSPQWSHISHSNKSNLILAHSLLKMVFWGLMYISDLIQSHTLPLLSPLQLWYSSFPYTVVAT